MRVSLSGPLDRLAARERIPDFSLSSPTVWLPAVVLVLGGLALRLQDFYRGMWEDEITVAYYTQIGIRNVISTVAQNGSHPPLYFLVAATDARTGLDVLPSIRIPSVVAGVATILVVYLIALKLTGRAGALVAGTLVMLSPVAVWYSDEGRMYALVWFFVLTSYLLLVWGHDSPRWRVFAVLHGAAVGLALWTDYSAALALAPQIVLIALLSRRRWFLGSWAAGWLTIVPWLFFLHDQYSRIEAQRFPGVGTDLGSWLAVLSDLVSVHADYASVDQTLPDAAAALLLLIVGGALVTTVYGAFNGRLRAATLVACLTAGALAVAVALALQGTVAVILPRVMGIITFGIVFALGTAASVLTGFEARVPRLSAAVAAAAVILCFGASGLNVVQNGTNGTEWDTVADTISGNAQPGDELIYYPIAAKYAVDPYLAPSSPWRTDYDGAWPKDEGTAERSFATWTAGKPRVWFVYLAITGVDMPTYDLWFAQHNYCRVMGDPFADVGVMEYQATATHC